MTVAPNVTSEQNTLSPGLIPASFIAIWSAAVPADNATDFDPDTGKAKFVIGGDEYEYSMMGDIFIEDGCFTYDKDEFAEEMRDKGLMNESVKKTLSLINRIDNL